MPETVKKTMPQGIHWVKIKSSGTREVAHIVGDKFCIANVIAVPPYTNWVWDPNWYTTDAIEVLGVHRRGQPAPDAS